MLRYARFVTASPDKYSAVTVNERRPIPNSHMPTAQGYKRMHDAWRASKDKNRLARADLERILRREA